MLCIVWKADTFSDIGHDATVVGGIGPRPATPTQKQLPPGGRELPAGDDVKHEIDAGVEEVEQTNNGQKHRADIPVPSHTGETVSPVDGARYLHDDSGTGAHDEENADTQQRFGDAFLLLVVSGGGGGGGVRFPRHSDSHGDTFLQRAEHGDGEEENDNQRQGPKDEGEEHVSVEAEEDKVVRDKLAERQLQDGGVELGREDVHGVVGEEHVGPQREDTDVETDAGRDDPAPSDDGTGPQGEQHSDEPLAGDQTDEPGRHPAQQVRGHDQHGLGPHPDVVRQKRSEASYDALRLGHVPQVDVEQVGEGQADQHDVGRLPRALVQQHDQAHQVPHQPAQEKDR